MTICKNCGTELTRYYCANCGQKANTRRITFGYLVHDIIHFFTHLEKGFLYTTWNLMTQPAKAIINFIAGKRIRYQTPVSYFLIWITVYFLFLLGLEMAFGENVVINYKEYFGPEATTRFAIRHLAWVLMVVIPFQSMVLYLLIAKEKYNYAESLVAVIYVLGTIIVYQLVFAILSLLFYITTGISSDLQVSDIFKILYLCLFIYGFMQILQVRYKLIKGFLFILLAFGIFTVWRFYGFPEVMKKISGIE